MGALGFRSSAAATAALVLLVPAARASTYTVNANGTGQFTDIQPAIAAAQAGDVLLVATGSYGAFTLDKGLVIIANGTVTVGSPTQVVNIPAGQRAALVGFRAGNLSVAGCAGPVALQDLWAVNSLSISQSNDVRIARLTANAWFNQAMGVDAVTIDNARVEFVDSRAEAASGWAAGSPAAPTSGGQGGKGIVVGTATRLHAARTLIRGGGGGESNVSPLQAGNGGPALSLSSPSEVFLTGPASTVEGGSGGIAWWNLYYCDDDGGGWAAIEGSGTVEYSGAMIQGGYTNTWHDCYFMPGWYAPAFSGPLTVLPIAPADPSLKVTGAVIPGSVITFTLYGEPGATAVLNLGRNMIVAPTPGVGIERLTTPGRILPFGVIPGSGSVSRNVTLPATFTPGLVFVGQAEVIGSNGLRRTNSAPVIVR